MKKECSTCGGTGQIGFFQGVSRFLLSWEECPQCCGTGFADQGKSALSRQQKYGAENKTGSEKKKKR